MVSSRPRYYPLFFPMTDKIVILCTCDKESEAETLARTLVEARLAACVNLLPRGRSIYRWQGAVESAEEWLLVIKTSRSLFKEVEAALAKIHSYEIPELLALSVVDGAGSYLNWMDQSLKEPGDA
jgi:periplasmic divalent cation tolerance protein